MTISDGFKGSSFLPQAYKEENDNNITTTSAILKFILSYSSKNLFLAFLIAFKTFFGAVPP